MYKIQTNCLRLFIAVMILFQLSGCIKVPDPLNPADAANVYTGCRIKQIANQPVPSGVVSTHLFKYNSNNDPVSVTNRSGGTGDPNLVFTYDYKNRLIEYSGIYANGYFEFVHHYGYSQNRIATDTQYVFGVYSTLSNYHSKRISYLHYDDLNRVAADSEVYIYPSIFSDVISYLYDQKGNLSKYDNDGKGIPYSYLYDNNLNPRRTNKIWMFIDRDYSVNNAVAASSYNTYSLPVNYNFHATNVSGGIVYGLNLQFAYRYYYGSSQIAYDCK
ncbi:MAG: hypothetical protein ABJB86_11410 [Bacteroidota bacterium]